MMETGDFLRIIMVVLGIFLLCMTFLSLARRRMTEQFCLVWGFFSLVLIFSGILLTPSQWGNYVSESGLVLILAALFCLVAGSWFISTQTSLLIRKNQELAMQISLLNQENERILSEIRILMEKEKTDLQEET